ncbi:penicillin-binding transpeptidase domain-containing protein, partial [Patescibacteria group bacterium]
QLYLNEIPYGSNAYGVESAARTYFNKPASKLTLPESAYLASLPKAPTYYSPYGSNTDSLDARKDTIIELMAEQEYIKAERVEGAQNKKVKFHEQKENILAPHFVFHVREELEELYGPKQVEQGGLKVITTLDLDKQTIAEEEVQNHVGLINSKGASNAALVSTNPQTGEILAMVGSVDYWNREIEGNVNVTTRLRQPGSSFKPYAYAAAFEKGFTPQTKVFDLNTDFGNGYEPKNYDLSQSGPVALESGLARSLNTPAVKAGYLVGPENVAEFARRMGVGNLPEDPSIYGLATPLGTREVKLLEHVNGLSTFANQGKYNKPTSILKVQDARGKKLFEHKPENKNVLDANIANTMNRILSTDSLRAPSFGSGTVLTLGGRPVAAKTGTTNEFKDALTVGYTPSLSAGVWAGNNDGELMHQGAAGFFVAAPIWNAYMSRALEGTDVESFTDPEPLPAPNATLQGKMGKGNIIEVDGPTGTLWTPNCPPENKKEIVLGGIHSILYYIDKDNPTGGKPSNPSADPQFENWEKPINGYSSKNAGDITSEPKETCDNYYLNAITVSIISPGNGEKVSGTTSVRASVTASNGVRTVEFFIDGSYLGADGGSPYSGSFDASSLSSGTHSLTVRATDKKGNRESSSITVVVEGDPEIPPSPPTINAVTSPTTEVTQALSGSKPAGSALFVNGIDVTGYTGSTTWSYTASLHSGSNAFTLYAKNPDGQTSSTISATIVRN